ncbi:hypothetical protein JHK85_001564 [Glycine max]|nr:hypothetical protein JHK85_001564 [Glycine max]
MELKLHASMASIPHAIFTHSSSFVPFCTYATPNISRRRNGNTNRRSTHKIPSLRKEKYPNEQKLMLNHQNQNPLNVDLVALREEGNLDQVLELMGQGVVSLELEKRVHEILRRSTFRGDVELSNRLIRMYCKCGSVKNARQVLDQMPDKKIAS